MFYKSVVFYASDENLVRDLSKVYRFDELQTFRRSSLLIGRASPCRERIL